MSTDREDRLQRYLEGRMDRDQRKAFEQEMLGDAELANEVYAELEVRAALAEAAHARVVGFAPRRRAAAAFLTVAVAAAIGFVVFILPRPEGERVFRGGARGAPTAVAPVGDLAAVPDRFVWTRDPGAVTYRLEIFGAEGDRLHVVTTRDTFFVTGGAFAVPGAGSWRATALDSIGVGVRGTGDIEFTTP